MSLGEFLPSSSTKLCLHLNGNSNDSSSSGNNGVDTNITYVDGKFGKCASFNGSSSGINCGTNASLDFGTGSFSFGGWIKASTGTSWRCIMSKRHQAGTGFQCYKDNAHHFFFDGIGTPGVSGSKVIDDGAWHFVMVVADRANSLLRLYVDGSPDGTVALGATTATDTSPMYIGRSGMNTVDYFNGEIDEVIIENRAWSAEEVKKDYTQSRGFFATL